MLAPLTLMAILILHLAWSRSSRQKRGRWTKQSQSAFVSPAWTPLPRTVDTEVSSSWIRRGAVTARISSTPQPTLPSPIVCGLSTAGSRGRAGVRR